ncbi:MAG TPA: hypothetical protein VFQ61_13515, partial [Polyangiaceae bacterium]|nr:hypothetical protein [Polyangiaceae bacterium]
MAPASKLVEIHPASPQASYIDGNSEGTQGPLVSEDFVKDTRLRHDRPTLPTSGVGREELRASALKPFLLRLKDERGDAAVRALLATSGIPYSVIEGDVGWVSVAAARRALSALATALGPKSLESRGDWMTHPEVLGAYVRLLRSANNPKDAFRYLALNAAENTRVGTYELDVVSDGHAEIRYRPRPDAECEQNDPLLCSVRRAELVSIPKIWGLAEASISHPRCIALGADECRYVLDWVAPRRPHWIAFGGLLGAASCGGAVSLSGS